MDAIETVGVDPLSIQLYDFCPQGLVTIKHLTLCANCAIIGHKQSRCASETAPRELYAKMLQLLTAYRGLVRESKGSYRLKPMDDPRASRQSQALSLDIITLDDDDEQQQQNEVENDENEEHIDEEIHEEEYDDALELVDDADDDTDDLIIDEKALAEEEVQNSSVGGNVKSNFFAY